MFGSHHFFAGQGCICTVEPTGRMGAFDAGGACLRCSDLCVFKGVVHPLSLDQQWLLLIITECSSVRQPLIRIYRAHNSHRKIQESHTDLKPLTKFMIIYYSYYKNPPISRDIFNIISCIKKCLTVSDCALVCTVTHNHKSNVKMHSNWQHLPTRLRKLKKRETTATFMHETNKDNNFLSKVV